jgi:hypothetical protein
LGTGEYLIGWVRQGSEQESIWLGRWGRASSRVFDWAGEAGHRAGEYLIGQLRQGSEQENIWLSRWGRAARRRVFDWAGEAGHRAGEHLIEFLCMLINIPNMALRAPHVLCPFAAPQVPQEITLATSLSPIKDIVNKASLMLIMKKIEKLF